MIKRQIFQINDLSIGTPRLLYFVYPTKPLSANAWVWTRFFHILWFYVQTLEGVWKLIGMYKPLTQGFRFNQVEMMWSYYFELIFDKFNKSNATFLHCVFPWKMTLDNNGTKCLELCGQKYIEGNDFEKLKLFEFFKVVIPYKFC